MTPQELKASILDLAIRGKLVPQSLKEGTGDELYEQIKSEDSQASSSKRKGKSKNIILPIQENDIPFDIPDTWKWVRLGTIGYTNIGLTYSPKDVVTYGTVVLRSSNIQNDNMDYNDIVRVKMDIPDNKMCHIGDILICARNGSKRLVGKAAIVDKDGMSFGAFMAIFRSPCNEYILQVINSAYFRNSLLGDTGTTTINQITQDMLKNALVPLPPLAEQKRIVAKIEELLPLIDRYEQAWSKLEDFNKRFPVDMQKSIIQMAIQGKLVPQVPEEGTGEELFQQIQAEKQALIKAGAIKKEKPLPEITEDEIPFDIPESWKWCRLFDIATLENGDRSGKYPVDTDYVEFGVPFFGAKDMIGRYMSFENVRYISKYKFEELGNGKLKDNDFVCLLRGSVGKIAVFKEDAEHQTGFICAQMVIVRLVNCSLVEYLYHIMTSPYYFGYIESKTTGTAVRQLPAKELSKCLIPLPPLAEQKRIVAKLEEILPLCERLK